MTAHISDAQENILKATLGRVLLRAIAYTSLHRHAVEHQDKELTKQEQNKVYQP